MRRTSDRCKIGVANQYLQDPVNGVLTGSDVDRPITAPANVVAARHVVEFRLKKIENGGVIGDRGVRRDGSKKIGGDVMFGAGGGGGGEG